MSKNSPEHAGGLVGVYQRRLARNRANSIKLALGMAVVGYAIGIPVAMFFTERIGLIVPLSHSISLVVMLPLLALVNMLRMLDELGAERRAALARTGWAIAFLPAAAVLPAGKDVEWLRWVLESLEFRADCKAPYRKVISSIILTYPSNLLHDWASTFQENWSVTRKFGGALRRRLAVARKPLKERGGWEGALASAVATTIVWGLLFPLFVALVLASHRITYVADTGLLGNISHSWREFRGRRWVWSESRVALAGRWASRKAREWNVAWWFAVIAALLVAPLEHIATYYLHMYGYAWWTEILWPLD
ncbi:hypothetical protein ACWCPD_39710 [Streptomyces sp. NPDC001935]